MTRKNIISLSVACAFTFLSITGLFMYFGIKGHGTQDIHVVFGLIFIGFAIFHILNNWSSLKAYSKTRTSGFMSKEIWISAAAALAIGAAGFFGLPAMHELSHFGEDLIKGGKEEGGKKGGRDRGVMFDVIAANEQIHGKNVSIILQKNTETLLPVIAIWAEDTSKEFIENLFVPAQMNRVNPGEKNIRQAIAEKEFESTAFDGSATQTWKAKAKTTTANYPKATPTGNFILSTQTTAKGIFDIVLEIADQGKAETYRTRVNAKTSGAYLLQSPHGVLLSRAIVELQ